MSENFDYEEFLSHLDNVLVNINKLGRFISLAKVMGELNITYSKDYEDRISEKLEADGYAERDRTTIGSFILITPTGRDFVAQGGYNQKLKKELEIEKREKEYYESTTRANNTNIKFFRWNLFFAFLNVLALLYNILRDWKLIK